MSSEDFKSFIVTNPDLVDEGIDVSGLRTNTDASILGNIPDYGGIQYEAYNPNRLSDLMRLYSGGFPMLDTPQATAPVTTTPDTGGGGGQAILPVFDDPIPEPITTDITSDQIDEFQTTDTTMPPMLSPDMGASIITDTTPADIYTSLTSNVAPDGTTMADMTNDVDLDFFENQTSEPVTPPGGGDPDMFYDAPETYQPIEPGLDYLDLVGAETEQTPVDQAPPGIMNPYDPSQSTVLGQPGIDRLDTSEVDIDLEPLDGEDYLGTSTPQEINIDSQVVSDPSAVNTILGPDGITYDAVTGNPIYEDLDAQAAATTLELNQIQDQPLRDKLSSSLTSATEGLSSVAELTGDKLREIGTSIAAAVGGVFKPDGSTITVPGLGEINVKQTIGGMILNKVVGGPITLAFSAVKALAGMLPEGGRGDVSDALGEKYGMDDIGRLTGGPMAGYSVGPDHAQTVQDRIDSIENRTAPQTDASRQKIAELKAYKSEVIATGSDGVITEPGTVVGPGEMPITQNEIDAFNETDTPITTDIASDQIDEFNIDPVDDISLIDAAADYQVQPSNVYQGGGSDSSTVDSSGNVTDSSGQSQGNINDEFSQPETTFEDQSYSGGGGGGSSNGGGKSIVCTAMYQTTGLEDWSKAMKIWYIYQKKYLTIQHQEGYHKLFKPFVKGMHKNKIIRAIGAHVAKHRTQDLKHIMFGSKSSWLGRVYRKILEPICYLVGKYAK